MKQKQLVTDELREGGVKESQTVFLTLDKHGGIRHVNLMDFMNNGTGF